MSKEESIEQSRSVERSEEDLIGELKLVPGVETSDAVEKSNSEEIRSDEISEDDVRSRRSSETSEFRIGELKLVPGVETSDDVEKSNSEEIGSDEISEDDVRSRRSSETSEFRSRSSSVTVNTSLPAIICPVSGAEIWSPKYTASGRYSRFLTDFDEEDKELGVGGFGCVTCAKNRLDNVSYAIKKLRLEAPETGSIDIDMSGSFDRFKREVVVMAELHHENVVRYYSSWLEPESVGLVLVPDDIEGDTMKVVDKQPVPMLFVQMERCYGSLKDILGPSLANQKVWEIFKQLVVGLHYIHGKSVRHGDISPANIFMSEDQQQFMYGDFGFSTNAEGTLPDGEVPPTTPYCAVELEEKNPYYTLKSDIFSLGMVLLDMLARFGGEHASSDRVRELFAFKKHRKFPLSATNLNIRVQELIESMTHPDSTARPSANDLLNSEPWTWAEG